MHKKSIFLVCFALLGAFHSAAQSSTVSQDSLATLFSKAKDHYYNYEYKDATEILSNVLAKAEQNQDTFYMFRSYNELGLIHGAIKDTSRGRMYDKKALEIAKASKIDSLISWAYNDLANSYVEDTIYYDKAIAYYQKAIAINEKAGLKEVESLPQYMNIAWTYLDRKEPNRAQPFLEKAQELVNVKDQHPLLYLNLDILEGRYLFYTGKDEKRMFQILKDAADSGKEKNYLEQAAQANEYLAKAFELRGNLTSAMASIREQQKIAHKIHSLEKEFIVTEASAKFDLEQYQKDLKTAQTEQLYADQLVSESRLRLKIFIISSIVFLIATLALFMLYKARRKYIARLHEKNDELTQAKEEAERLSNLKTQFFSTVSHELRTPLYGVIGISSILLEDRKLREHRDDLKSLKFSADYLLALINDVLMLNKMDAKGVTLERTPFMLSKLLNNIKRSFAFSLEQNKNTIHLEMDEKVPDQLMGDSVRLSQILMNLVGNAVKFNENGNIWIKTQLIEETKEGNYKTRFIIQDDGIGIPKESQESIFEEFSQVDNKNYNYQGTGLGLPIVKKLLKLFGSDIHLESTVNEGATFRFVIELEKHEVPVEKVEISESTDQFVNEEHAFENIHILVVDDNRINQKITQKILKTRHFSCSLADNGEQAIEMAKNHSYDLILMDIHMPGIGGLEATETIRQFDKTTPVVALTAVEIDEMRKRIMDSGMNDIILKPYDISQFLNTILRNLITTFAHKPIS
ncbi:MAG: response regulator [Bacteroidota bacterium]